VLGHLRQAVPDGFLALYAHGSLVAGDFAIERSDLDVLAVLSADPNDELLAVLAGIHADLDARFPDWAGRIEVEYASLEAIQEAAAGALAAGRVIARISPGEALHLLPATTHRAVTWAAVHDSGRRLLGPPPSELLPEFDPGLVRAALVDHVRDWPVWVGEMTAPGAQSYSVLTLCRAIQRLGHGVQLSKRAAADRTIKILPNWSGLIAWARDWWYSGGADTDPGRAGEVRAFVVEQSAALLDQERRSAAAVSASAGRNASTASSDNVTSSGVPSTDVTLKNDRPSSRNGTTSPDGSSSTVPPG
jgi:hypothetical protein